MTASAVVGSLSTSFNMSRTVSLSTTVTETDSQTVTRSLNSSMIVGPKKHGRIELLAFETTVEIPFKANVVIDGNVDANKSGISKASQLLSVSERTVPFSGVLRITNVSAGQTNTFDLAGVPNCSGQDQPIKTVRSQTTLAPGSIDKTFLASLPTWIWKAAAVFIRFHQQVT